MNMLGMHGAAFANYTVDDCDFLIALGRASTIAWPARRRKFARNAKRIAHIDIDRLGGQQGQARAHGAHIGSLPEALRAARATASARSSTRDYYALARPHGGTQEDATR